MEDWLTGLPSEGRRLDEQERILAAQMAANPAARQISDEEAEAFMAVAVSIRGAQANALRQIARGTGVPCPVSFAKGRKPTVVRILRRWRNEKVRKLLEGSLRAIHINPIGSVAEDGDRITLQMLTDLYRTGFNLLWLVVIVRMLGRAAEIPAFLAGLEPSGERIYRIWLDMSRLKLREIVYGDPVHREGPDANEQRPDRLMRTLRSKQSQTQPLLLEQQRLEREGRALRGAATRTEKEVQELLEQARRETAAAARDLERRRAQQKRELAEQEARHKARVAVLKKRIAEARQEFAAAVGERQAWLAALEQVSRRAPQPTS